MADSEAFEFVSGELEQQTALDRLAARGTLRIALKQAGLDARSVDPGQMSVVLQRVLPSELVSRGVLDADAVCSGIQRGLGALGTADGPETPDAVFRRLGG